MQDVISNNLLTYSVVADRLQLKALIYKKLLASSSGLQGSVNYHGECVQPPDSA